MYVHTYYKSPLGSMSSSGIDIARKKGNMFGLHKGIHIWDKQMNIHLYNMFAWL
jgi:hypothetical protein